MSSNAKTNTHLIDGFIRSLRATHPDTEVAIVLVGSVARSAATAQSDLDLLVVSEEKVVISRTPDLLHIQVMTESQFLGRLRAGDDFAAWCVRFGVPVVQTVIWSRIVESPDAMKWPDWRKKIEHAARRLLLANELFGAGDRMAANEELVYATSHVGRAILLREGIFPLSRPEMISQLRASGFPQVGLVLETLSAGIDTDSSIRRAILYLKRLLIHLERSRFESYVQARARALRAKNERLVAARRTR